MAEYRSSSSHLTTTEAVETAFSLKLHIVLDESEKQGFHDVISWHGENAFMVHKPKQFEDSIMKEYLNPRSSVSSSRFACYIALFSGTSRSFFRTIFLFLHDIFPYTTRNDLT
jgi:hypothetical protein